MSEMATTNSSCFDGVKYEFTPELGVYDDRDAFCRSTGARPAIFRNEEQYTHAIDFLLPLLAKNKMEAYIGLTRPLPRRSPSKFESLYWADGTSLVFGSSPNEFPWASGEPNDQAGVEDCIEIQRQDGRWNDLKCNSQKAILCERRCGEVAFSKATLSFDPMLIFSLLGGVVVIALLVFLVNFQLKVMRANQAPTLLFEEDRKDKPLSVASMKSTELKESARWKFPRNSDNSLSPVDPQDPEYKNLAKIFAQQSSQKSMQSSNKGIWNSFRNIPNALAVSVVSRGSITESEMKQDDNDSINDQL